MSKDAKVYINSTLSYCVKCGQKELARIFACRDGVFMERLCPAGSSEKTKIAADYRWYMERMDLPREVSHSRVVRETKNGCPHDCGICERHAGGINLPVFSITNDCNLDCPICFTYNRPDQKYYKSVEDTRTILSELLKLKTEYELVNITGGEPTLHPELFEIIKVLSHESIYRITLNTNGIKIASDLEFAQKIKDSGVQLVLSLNTFDQEKSRLIHGRDITQEKRKALEVLERLDIPTTILCVCIKGINENDVTDIVQEYFSRPFVRTITIQNMTFTGKNGSVFEPRQHITIDEVEGLLCAREGFTREDFFPLGSYHPLCYSVAYYIVHQGRLLALSRMIDKKVLSRFSKDSYLLNADADFSKYFMDGINRLWAENESPELIKVLRDFIEELYPRGKAISACERRKRAERLIKMIYIHPHMDEDNFDLDRVSFCGDLVPDESGRMVPACSYNLLYRQNDPRFWF